MIAAPTSSLFRNLPADGSQRVLIVDDDADFRDSLADMLQLNGYQIRAAAGITDAKHVAWDWQPDIALIDIRLGRENGIELLDYFAAKQPSIACIPVTAYASVDITIAALRGKAVDFIEKPIPSDRLLLRLQQVFHRRQIESVKSHADAILNVYRQIVSASSDLLAFIDRNTRFQLINDAYRTRLQCTNDALIGQPVLPVWATPPFVAAIRNSLAAALTGNAARVRHSLLLPSGDFIIADTRLDPVVQADGTVAGIAAVTRDITESVRANDELRRSRDSLRLFTERLDNVREEERKAISRTCHDDLGQALTGLKLDLAWMLGQTDGKDKRLAAHARRAITTVDHLLASVRDLSRELRPALLRETGLVEAINEYLREFKRRTGLKYRFTNQTTHIGVDERRDRASFAVLQEALTNIIRHASATSVSVQLRVKHGDLVMQISDDGTGITPQALANSDSLGVIGMQERAAALGGTLTIGPRRHRPGTTVTLGVPLIRKDQLNRAGHPSAV